MMKKQLNSSNGIKMISLLIFTMIGTFSLLSCEKKAELSFDFQPIETVFFPENKIYMTFKIIPKGGDEPYSIKWHEPSNLQGEGPFTVKIDSDLSLDFEIQDSENEIKHLTYKIVKDTIDSLKYDYRNKFIGNYSCNVRYTYRDTDIDSVRDYFDTLMVTKPEGFLGISVSNKKKSWGMSYNDSNEFYGYHRFVSFNHDSIYFTESGPLGFYYTNSFHGTKIESK